MNRIGVPESEHKELVAYLKKTYRYEDGGIVNRKTGRRQGYHASSGYLGFSFKFKGKGYHSFIHRVVWALCYNELSAKTIDHINGNKHDNRIENLRVVSLSENRLNMLLPWEPNKDTGVAGVVFDQGLYRTKIHGRFMSFHDPYEAFYWAIACGKRYKPTPSPSQRGGELSRARKQ